MKTASLTEKITQVIFIQESLDSLYAALHLEPSESPYIEPFKKAQAILDNLYVSIRMDIEELEEEGC